MTNPAHAGKLQRASASPKGMVLFLCYSPLTPVDDFNSGERTENCEFAFKWEVKGWLERFQQRVRS